MEKVDYSSVVWYSVIFLLFLGILFTIIYFTLPGGDAGGYGSGSGGIIIPAVTNSDPASLTITKVTDKIVTFSNPLKFNVIRDRTQLNMFLSYGFTGSVNVIAQNRGIKIPTEGEASKDLDLTTFTLVDGSGSKFSGLTEGLNYYIQFVFVSSDPEIEDEEYTYEFVAPRRIQFGTGTTIQLPVDGSKGQLVWTWVVKTKTMIAKYRRVSSTIPWFGGDADFEDDIIPRIPNNATYMLVKPGELYYRLSDETLVDAFDNETETKDDISSSSVTTYST